jgi:hypothetical protein
MRPSTAPFRDETGQALVIVTVALAVLFGCVALVLDIGYAYYVKRSMQASADAAALAGAQELPDSGGAEVVAAQYSGTPGGKNERSNLPIVDATAATQCRAGSPCNPVNALEVVQTAVVPMRFAKLFGLDTVTVSARAVAQVEAGKVPWAIFAYDSACDGFGLKYNGNVFEVDGGIRSNGEFAVNGMNITAGYASSGGPGNCEPESDGGHVDFGGSPDPVIDNTLHDWPAYFTTSQFSCTYTGSEFKFNKNNETIPSGVYCATKLFEANANHQKGNITVLAPEIKVDGNNQQLTPYLHDVLFFATGTKELVLNGNSYDWTGIIFHPGGRIKINGNADSILTGLIEGLEVEVNGNAFQMTGTGPGSSDASISLVE